MSDTAISVKHLKKNYRYYKSNHQKIQSLLFGRDSGDVIKVLKTVSFEIKKGEKVALFGTNLSGKTTLMRIIAGIVEPDEGSVKTDGKITAVFDHRLGFQKTMSGIDNYKIRCKLIGWSDEKIKEKKEEVFKYAGIKPEDAENPLGTYSVGCPSRLGFAISTVDKPEIMLFDDRFSFGGKSQTIRAVQRLKKITAGENVTLLLTVRSEYVAKSLCQRGLVLHRGKIVFDGDTIEAYEYYVNNCRSNTGKKRSDEQTESQSQSDGYESREDINESGAEDSGMDMDI